MRSRGLWSTVIAAPHRVMFFGGAVQTVAVMLWWLFELVTRSGAAGHAMSWTVAPGAAHVYLMIYGLFPFFMFGFLMTVFPRWMNGPELPPRRYIPAFLLLALGATVFYAGLLGSTVVLAVGILCTLAGWAMAIHALWRVLRDTRHPDRQHPKAILVALVLGWCSLAAYLASVLSGDAALLRFAIQGGLWLFLLPVFASVLHRMLPFFTRSALPQHAVARPDWPWYVMLVGSGAHGLLQSAGLPSLTWLGDIPTAVAVFHLTRVWGLFRSLRIPLLGVLHVGFAWIGIAMMMFAAQSFVSFIENAAVPVWGFAPLHALTIGCFATLMIGMGTRVTLGHSGLPMQAGRAVTLMFAGIQLAAVLRITADLAPARAGFPLYIAAASLWLACFLPWALRYAALYWRPRADGLPG